MENGIKLNWFDAIPNFGDVLNVWWCKNILQRTPIKCNNIHGEKHYLMFGSVLHCATKCSNVYGSGFINNEYGIDPSAKLFAVRGYISKERCKQFGCDVTNTLIGDPALLMPLVYDPKVENKEIISIVPNYEDYNFVANKFKNTEFNIINPLLSVETVINEIVKSSLIISSSLHGLIIADAYNIPNIWVKSDNVIGNGYKFYDYFSSINRQPNNTTFNNMNIDKIFIPSESKKYIMDIQQNLLTLNVFKGGCNAI